MPTSAPSSPGIYTITHIPTGRIYVGQSVNMRKRMLHHLAQLRAGTHGNARLQRIFATGEEHLRFEVLEECEREFLDSKEQFWINTLVPEFNLSPFVAPNRGHTFSDDSRAKLRAAFARPETRKARSDAAKARWEDPEFAANVAAKISVALRGKKLSAETRAKLSAARKGKRYDASFGAKVSAAKIAARFEFSAESREKMRQAHLGSVRSADAIEKHRAVMTGRKLPPQQREAMSRRMLGTSVSEETRKKISASLRGRKLSPETLAKRSATLRAKKLSREAEHVA